MSQSRHNNFLAANLSAQIVNQIGKEMERSAKHSWEKYVKSNSSNQKREILDISSKDFIPFPIFHCDPKTSKPFLKEIFRTEDPQAMQQGNSKEICKSKNKNSIINNPPTQSNPAISNKTPKKVRKWKKVHEVTAEIPLMWAPLSTAIRFIGRDNTHYSTCKFCRFTGLGPTCKICGKARSKNTFCEKKFK